ncbi:MAG TPA: glycoside hydrolase family 13 protein [Chloroflexota bacterium]|nr:glycoside hydrolase family 13 protein [Chloroflexota bacterium]
MDRLFFGLSLTLVLAFGGFALGQTAQVSASTAAKPVDLHLYANGWDGYYRNPFGAARTDSQVQFRLRSSRAVTKVTFDLVDESTGNEKGYPMSLQSHNGTQDFWSSRITMPSKAVQIGYHFRAQAGKTVQWYADNSSVYESGPGQTYANESDVLDYELTVYEKSFQTPAWMAKAVIYQIFPDRFYNGTPSNDPRNGQKFGYITVIKHKSWNELPVEDGRCTALGLNNYNCDFFGGDLQGVIDKLGYLHELGINVIYLNPIFLAPSNHKYDTSNFLQIDPEFGTLQTFHTLITDAKALGIRIILDGAFEETGSDSVYFDQYGRFKSQNGPGAYDSKSSPYYSWYTFYTWPKIFQEWGGVPTLPELKETAPVQKFMFEGPNSVAQYWPSQGTAGWRMDSADMMPDAWWRAFRSNVKAAYPNSVMIAEDFSGDPTPQLSGGEWDGVMNYRFRDPVLDFFANGFGSQNNSAYTASAFLYTEMGLLSEVPRPAVLSSMNLVDSHDTIRVIASLRNNKQALRLVALYQMTWLGAPTIYYGDETALYGLNDPDNRRTFPWDHQDKALEAYYSKIIHMRLKYDALMLGSVSPLFTSDHQRVVAYLRQWGKQKIVVAINDSNKSQTVMIPVAQIANGTHLSDVLNGGTATVSKGALHMTMPAMSGRVLLAG